MQLNSWRLDHQIAVENEAPTASWLVGAQGVTGIEMLVSSGVVVITRESGRDIVLGPQGYGVCARPPVPEKDFEMHAPTLGSAKKAKR